MNNVAEDTARLAEEKLARIDLADARPPKSSDEALALRFAERHGDGLRYVAAWGRWFAWTGTQWEPDDTLAAFDRARAICRVAAAETTKGKAIASAKTVAAVERLAKSDRRVAATVEQWDANADTFNTDWISP